jgi:hypothetical protein
VVVTLLFFDGCPNWQTTNTHLEALSAEFGFDLDRCHVETDEDAQRLHFRGSPTVLIDGRDVFATGDEPIGLSCRMYRTDHGLAGAPGAEQLHEALTAANINRT